MRGRRVSRRGRIDGVRPAHRIVSASVAKRTREGAGERGVVDRSQDGGTVPIDVHRGADESTIALPVVEGESIGGREQRDGADDNGGGKEHG